jgi:nitrate reductase alpha subunit
MNNRTYPRSRRTSRPRASSPGTPSRAPRVLPLRARVHRGGENLIVHREPIDSTFYEPNVIVAKPHPAIRPKQPEDYGLRPHDVSTETRQVRNVMRPTSSSEEQAPAPQAQGYTHVYHTPKYRHGAHTTPVDTDFTGVLFGPFGDVYRHDKRLPSVTEGYVDINPVTRRAGRRRRRLRVDRRRPQTGRSAARSRAPREHKIARLLLRVRYYPGTPAGRHPHLAQHVRRDVRQREGPRDARRRPGEEPRDELPGDVSATARHQSATRAWLKPTLMTETLVHKDMFGQTDQQGLPRRHPLPGRRAARGVRQVHQGRARRHRWARPLASGGARVRPTYENEP